MKIRFSLFLLALVAASAAPQAQGLKIGVLDPDLIVVRMPEYAQVRTQIAQLEAQIGATLQAKQDSAVALNTELRTMADSPVVSAGAREEKAARLQRLVGELQNGEEQGLRYLSDQEVRLLQPALIRLNSGIQELAEEMGIDLVMTPVANNAPVLLYANFDSDRVVDMTLALFQKLGIEIPEGGEGVELSAPPPPAPGN